ncbi:MAG: hypothetical protein IJA35_04275 [Clostridia bacterium]|nr:hypothetical protein [Clostridia bacterium]
MDTNNTRGNASKKHKKKGSAFSFILCILLLISALGFGITSTLRNVINEETLTNVARGIDYGSIPVGALIDEGEPMTLAEMLYGLVGGIGIPISIEQIEVMANECGIAELFEDVLLDYCAYIKDGSGKGYIESSRIAEFVAGIGGDYMKRLLGEGTWMMLEDTIVNAITSAMETGDVKAALNAISLRRLEESGEIDLDVIRFLISDVMLYIALFVVIITTILLIRANRPRARKGILKASILTFVVAFIFIIIWVALPILIEGDGNDALLMFISSELLPGITESMMAVGVIFIAVGFIELIVYFIAASKAKKRSALNKAKSRGAM